MRHLALVLAVALSGAGLEGGTPGLAAPTVGTPDAAGANAGQNRPKSAPANPLFKLAVDSIVLRPDLVRYPPADLRRPADSQKLYFEWRKPSEKEPSTYAASREGGNPGKLSDDEIKNVPPANGRWDAAHRRVIFVDGGDIVMVDGIAGTRRRITRTSGAESNARWASHDTHVTDVRDDNLFIVPIDGAAGRACRAADRRRVEEAENHSFTEAASWADEYKRILKLFEDNLRTPRNGKAT